MTFAVDGTARSRKVGTESESEATRNGLCIISGSFTLSDDLSARQQASFVMGSRKPPSARAPASEPRLHVVGSLAQQHLHLILSSFAEGGKFLLPLPFLPFLC